MGSYPFGLVASAIGAPRTVSICGVLAVGLIAYIVLGRPQLRAAKPIGEV
jgi:hypothetical protein